MRYRFTSARRAALKKAQKASARKRRRRNNSLYRAHKRRDKVVNRIIADGNVITAAHGRKLARADRRIKRRARRAY